MERLPKKRQDLQGTFCEILNLDFMNDKHLYILLSVIKNNGDIKRLTREGISYQEIAQLTQKSIETNLVIYTDDLIELSESGLNKLKELEKLYKEKNKELWIENEKESIIPKLEKDFVFLPNQNELLF